MNKYNNGKIYKIIDNTNGNVYYGSTVQTLGERLSRHISSLNCSSKINIEIIIIILF
jgi:Uri superfamily endonuclease